MAQGKKHTAEVRRKVRELRKSGEKLRGIAEKTGPSQRNDLGYL
jgi:hypothetical protein